MAIPLFEMKISKAPIVILKGGDRQLTFYKVKKFASKYFAIKDPNGGGMVFELDDRYEYRYKKSSIYIYNFSNFKPISLTGLAEIDRKLKTEGKSQLDNIDVLLSQLSEDQIKDFSDKIKDPKAGFSPETKRFLEDYSTDDENSKTEMMIALHHQKNPITKYSSQLMGMGINSGNYAIIQIGHKKLDIVPMHLHDNRAYTEYGVFNFTVDNLYLVKKQVMAFFILNDTEDSISQPTPKPVARQIKQMARKKKWSYLETFNKPKRTKMASSPRFSYQVKIEKVEAPVEDEKVKARINAALKPSKPIPTMDNKNKKNRTIGDEDDLDFKILERLSRDEEPVVEQTTIEPASPEPILEEPAEPIVEEPVIEEPIVEEQPLELEQDVTTEQVPVEESIVEEPIEENKIELDIAEATGPPGAK